MARIKHIAIRTPDPEKTAAFYKEVFGLKEVGQARAGFYLSDGYINLAILNLLPVPMLDGGHLLFFVIEAVLGRPLSLRKREVAQQIGLALLLLLMIFALYNDVSKLPPEFSRAERFDGCENVG